MKLHIVAVGHKMPDWIAEGFGALETMGEPGGPFLGGASPDLSDVCLVPQMYNARRFKCDLTGLPRLAAIDTACRALPAFAQAAPEAQADAV